MGHFGWKYRPKLSPTASGIAAHYHPSLCGHREYDASRITAGDTYARQSCEIRRRNFRQRARLWLFRSPVAQRGSRRRRLSSHAEGRDPRRQPLVLPHRAHHQAPLLVSPGGRRNFVASRSADRIYSECFHSDCLRTECRRSRKAGRAGGRGSHAARGRRCACRTAARGERRATQAQRCPASAAPVNPATSNANRASALDANALSSVVASRWPDPSAVSSTIRPAPAPTQIAANAPPQPDPQQADSAQADSTQSDAAAVPPPAAAVVPLAAADSSQGLPASLPMLLAVMTGALMLAGITASIVLKFGACAPRRRRTHPPRQDLGFGGSGRCQAAGSPERRDIAAPAPSAARPRPTRRAQRQGRRFLRADIEAGPQEVRLAISRAAAAAPARTSSGRCGVRV